ncbi:MAG: 50S ribosomal protein L9 [Proteobacteria bacterium]|nr:50S ribosomal protein L9 [Pseudomonadota bacterium]
MKVILKEEVDNLGTVGDVVDVARGYARNFLLPQGLALEATAHNIGSLDKKRRLHAEKTAQDLEAARVVADTLDGVVLEFVMKAGETGKLYGSVTNMDLAGALADQAFDIERKQILLREPIKRLGRVDVPIKLHRDLTVSVTVAVIGDGEPEVEIPIEAEAAPAPAEQPMTAESPKE